MTVSLGEIRAAAERIRGVVHRTPLLSSQSLSAMSGAEVWLKAENLQRAGSFKVRGATNRLRTLSAEALKRGVIAASAGNHAQGLALASRLAGPAVGMPDGVPCTIVMPRGAPITKRQATLGYGAAIVLHGDTYDEAQAEAQRLAGIHGRTLVHAFDDEAIIAGQGTVGLETAEDLPGIDLALVPVGGGGLASGVATALADLAPRCRVVGVQATAATGAERSLREGTRVVVSPARTIADGIAVGAPSDLTLSLMRRFLDGIVTVSEEEVAHAILVLHERTKLTVEGAGAVGVAALLSGKVAADGKRVAVVVSGGNIDTNVVARTLQHGMAHAGRYLALRVSLPDRPGALARLADVIARMDANIVDVAHHRYGLLAPVGAVEVEITLETMDMAHGNAVKAALRQAGYSVVSTGPGPWDTGEGPVNAP
jgi:threonine dehydratase